MEVKPKSQGKTILQKCKCGKEYHARIADINRGWAKSCSKSCAAIKRTKKQGRKSFIPRTRIIEEDIDLSWDAHKSY